MPKQVNQRQLIGDVVFEPEHDAPIICGAVEFALLVFKTSELLLVLQRRIELIAIATDDVVCTLLEISRAFAHRPKQIGIAIDVIIAAEAGFS
jgi:hypothetical protein